MCLNVVYRKGSRSYRDMMKKLRGKKYFWKVVVVRRNYNSGEVWLAPPVRRGLHPYAVGRNVFTRHGAYFFLNRKEAKTWEERMVATSESRTIRVRVSKRSIVAIGENSPWGEVFSTRRYLCIRARVAWFPGVRKQKKSTKRR
jgi:hypothetical protein